MEKNYKDIDGYKKLNSNAKRIIRNLASRLEYLITKDSRKTRDLYLMSAIVKSFVTHIPVTYKNYDGTLSVTILPQNYFSRRRKSA